MRTRAAGSSRPRSFGALLGSFLEASRARGLGQPELRRRERVLLAFFDYLRDRRLGRIEAVTEAHVVSFGRHVKTLKNRFGRRASDDQQRVWLSVVKTFFGFLEERQWILANPAAGIELPKIDRLPRLVLTEAQALRLVHAPDADTWTGKRDRALLELLYGTGIRAGECVRLDLGDVSLLERRLLIRNGKGRKDRIVPIPLRAAAALDVYLREVRPGLVRSSLEPALFLSRQHRRLSQAAVNALVLKHGRAARISAPLHPHALRHSCATHLLQGGADIRHVQELLGHRILDTTAIYTRVQISDLRKVLRRCHPRERRA